MIRVGFALGLAGVLLAALGATPTPARAVNTAGFPSGFQGYHDYSEMEAAIDAAVAARPSIINKRSIGTSHEGRQIWAVKISDNVGSDEDEPEVLMESLHHAREHLTVEMALHIIELLVDNYRANPANIANQLEQRVTDIVNGREVWIVPMVNPDGAEWDISNSTFQNWRRNRQPIPGAAPLGVDLNRNWGFKWACCGGSSGKPGTPTYRGPTPWSTPEVSALRDFVLSRVRGGRQQIRAAISWHTFNEEVMWPYGYTTADQPRTMSPDDLLAFRALGHGMADRNGYVAQQMSDLYILDGAASDWLYGDQRIFAFTVEMYPTDGSNVGGFYPPDAIIAAQTARNDEMVLHFLELSDCPYRAAAGLGDTHCGPLNDDFETGRGWTFNAAGTDTATSGRWERGTAQKTSNAAGVKQRAYGFSGLASLVTGAQTGGSVTANDVDGGVTSALAPAVRLGSPGSTGWTLSFKFTFAHNAKATAGDQLRLKIDGTTVFSQAANRTHRNAAWTEASVNLDAYAGQTVQLLVEAVDGGADHLVEAAIDDLRLYRAP